VIRPATADDFVEILRLNSEWVRFTSELDVAALAALHSQSPYHRVVESGGRVVAFLLALREGADYGSPNYRWFEERGGTFLYIDRVIVGAAAQRGGVASQLYDDVVQFASATNAGVVVCEIDADPPNEASRRFHERRGFREVGSQMVAGGAKRVSLLELQVR
jgi:predicted GNAT superfamily acetyltransferase